MTGRPVPAPIAVALDAPDLATAAAWARAVTPYVSTLKIGLELFCRYGPAIVEAVRSEAELFLDLKLHDIPNTVAGAARAVAALRPDYLTVHAAGGTAMIAAAAQALPDCRIAGVTVLTSLSAGDVADLGWSGPPADVVRRLAVLAVGAGARALVCSPQEVAAVRAEVGSDVVLITPGVRPAGAGAGDQARVATPQQALAAGADLLVVGRPITGAPDPGAAAAALAREIGSAWAPPRRIATGASGHVTWRPLTAADLPLLTEWLREPLVARWWNHETTPEAVERDFGPSVRGEEPGEDLVVSLDGRPIGLVQRSLIGDYPDDVVEFGAVIDLPVGAVELDYLIGYADLRGRGLGPRIIAAVVESTWRDYPAAPAVLVAVVAANVASWRALEKAGLQRIAEAAMSPDNPLDDPLHYIYRLDRPPRGG